MTRKSDSPSILLFSAVDNSKNGFISIIKSGNHIIRLENNPGAARLTPFFYAVFCRNAHHICYTGLECTGDRQLLHAAWHLPPRSFGCVIRSVRGWVRICSQSVVCQVQRSQKDEWAGNKR